jgi:hypothetical protein
MSEVEFRIVDASEQILIGIQALEEWMERSRSPVVVGALAHALRVYAERCWDLELQALTQVDQLNEATYLQEVQL